MTMNHLKMAILALQLLLAASYAFSSDAGVIRGRIVDRDTAEPLPAANVQIEGQAYGDVANDTGLFLLKGLVPGNYALRVSMIGYEQQVKFGIHVNADDTTTVNFRLKSTPIEFSGVEIKADRVWDKALTKASAIGVRKMAADEIVHIPGAMDDPTRAVQIFSGVTGGGDYHGFLAIRGGSPDQSLVVTDGIVMPNPYRFRLSLGGGFSAINPNTTQDLHLHLGGFSAEFGNALSSVLEVSSRNGARDRPHLQGSVNITDMNAIVEGPLAAGKGSFLFSARRTYYDLILNQFAKSKNSSYPFFEELSGKVTLVPTSNDLITISSSHFKEGAQLLNEFSEKGGIEETVKSLLGSLQWRHLFSSKFTLQSRFSFYDDATEYRGTRIDTIFTILAPESPPTGYEVGEEVFESVDSQEKNWFISQTLQYQANEQNWFTTGASAMWVPAKMDFLSADRSFLFGRIDSPPRVNFDEKYRFYQAFAEFNTKTASNLHIRLGTRFDYSTLIEEGHLSPRFSMWYELGEQTTLETAWGVFYQYPNPMAVYTRSIPVDLSLNLDDLSAEKSIHQMVSFRQGLSDSYALRIQGYYRDISSLILPANEETFVPQNTGHGRSFGSEIILEKQNKDSWLSGVLSYSYGNAKYRDIAEDEWFRFKYDRRHSLTGLGEIRMSAKWRVSVLGQISSGLPFTDTFKIRTRVEADATTSTSTFLRGKRNEASLPTYKRIDARLSYTTDAFAFYLDLINVTNSKNVYDMTWDKHWISNGQVEVTERQIYSLPRIASLGLRFRI